MLCCDSAALCVTVMAVCIVPLFVGLHTSNNHSINSVTDWGGDMSASCTADLGVCNCGHGHIMHCSSINSCQSATTSEIVKCFLSHVMTHEQCYSR